MNPNEKKAITKNLVRLTGETSLTAGFLNFMEANEILRAAEVNKIQTTCNAAGGDEEAGNYSFYTIIQKRCNSFQVLCDALRQTCQGHLADLLEADAGVSVKNTLPSAPPPTPTFGGSSGSFSCAPDSDITRLSGTNLMLCINIEEHIVDGNLLIREGAKKDLENIHKVFSKLGYQFKPDYTIDKGDYTKEELLTAIEDFQEECIYFKPSSCIIFIGSHGSKDAIQTSDGQLVKIDEDIISKFYNESSPVMMGKPKVFIIQACRSFIDDNESSFDEPQSLEADHKLSNETRKSHRLVHLLDKDQNIIKIFPQVPGLLALRHHVEGSILVKHLTQIFEEHAHNTSFRKMIEMVGKKIREDMELPGGQALEVSQIEYTDFYFPLPNSP